ncbi:hypothetical protein FGB62_1g319 [Gracilaria domingensis]|nr:hypothetical protein FGB62_1g319 [Gracilaria domingensis]
MTPTRQPRPRQAAAATRRRTRRAERQPSVDDVIEIWWDVDKTYYKGRLTHRLEADMHFTMLYDDGETEDVNLHNEFWKFADDDEAFRSPPLSSDSDPGLNDRVLQQRANASQSHRDSAIGQQQTAARSAQLPNPSDNPKPHVVQGAQFAENFVMRTRKPRPESLGKPKPKLKRTHRQSVDKSAIAKRTARADTTTPLESQNAATKPLSSTQLPRSHVPAFVDPAPLVSVSGSQDMGNTGDKVNSAKDGIPSKQSLPIRMKLVKTADAKANYSSFDPVVVQKQSSGLKRKLLSDPSAPSSDLKKQDRKPSAKVEPALDACALRQDHDLGQQLKTEPETNELDKSNSYQTLPLATSGDNPNLPSPKRRRSVRRRIHSVGDENSTDSSSSPHPTVKEDTHVKVEDQMESIITKDSEKPVTTAVARDHSIPLKVSLKRANSRVMTASKDPTPQNIQVNAQFRIDAKQANVASETRTGEPVQHAEVEKRASGSLNRANGQNLSVSANQTSNGETEIINSSKKSAGPLRIGNEDLHTQIREEQRTNNIARIPNLELISPVSGLPELDSCIDTAFGRRLEPVENHLNNLTSEVQQVRSGFDSARQTFESLKATKESDIKGVKEDLTTLNQKVEVMNIRLGDLCDNVKTCRADTLLIKRDVASIISFLRHEAQLRSQRTLVSTEQAATRNSVRNSTIPESRTAPPRQNGQVAAASQAQSSAPSNLNVHHYATQAAQGSARNAVEYQQQAAPAVGIAHGARQRSNTFPVQRTLPTQNPPHVSVQGAQVQPQASPIPSQSNRVQHQQSHVPAQGTQPVTARQQQIVSQPALYVVNYGDNRNRAEVFTYQVMELVARQVTVWLLETSHEHHKVGMTLDTWAKRTSSTTYARIAPRLAMYRSYEHAMSTLALNLSHGPVDLTWFMSPFENQCTERARQNYNAWDPPPNDEEWIAEMHLLKELAVGFHRTFQNYSHPESTVLEVSVLLTRRAARDYEEAGYRPILSLTNDAQRQQEAQAYNAQPKGTPISGWRPT